MSEDGRMNTHKTVIVMRHGAYEDGELTEGGLADVFNLAMTLAQTVPAVGAILHSPEPRAEHTARIVQDVYTQQGLDAPKRFAREALGLSSESRFRLRHVFIAAPQGMQEALGSAMCLVTHQPQIDMMSEGGALGTVPRGFHADTNELIVARYLAREWSGVMSPANCTSSQHIQVDRERPPLSVERIEMLRRLKRGF